MCDFLLCLFLLVFIDLFIDFAFATSMCSLNLLA